MKCEMLKQMVDELERFREKVQEVGEEYTDRILSEAELHSINLTMNAMRNIEQELKDKIIDRVLKLYGKGADND